MDETEAIVVCTKDQETDESFYDAYLKKIWIVDQEERDMEDASFVITEIRNGEIEGYLCTHGGIETYYWHELSVESSSFITFHGTVSEGKAVSSFECEGDQAEFVIQFCENDRIQASLKCEGTGMYKSCQFRPYNISDEKDFYDISSAEVSLVSWGEVSLVWGTANSLHPHPRAYMVNDKSDILYGFDCSRGINGSKVWDIFVRDRNGDGLEDIMTVACMDESPEGYRMVTVYYQMEDGTFQEERTNRDAIDLPERYYGNYEIVRFCPADIGKEMSDEEVEKMLGRTVVMQNDGLSITYDSESRAGVRKDREFAQGADGILEFRDERDEWDYYWESAEPETLSYGGTPDEVLRAAVGEEYYKEIDGIIHSHFFGVQQFYTLKGGQEMILYSLVTGQYFILSKIE